MTERPHPVRIFVDVADPWTRRVLRDALGSHADVRFVSTAAAADVRVVSAPEGTGGNLRLPETSEIDAGTSGNGAASALSDRERDVLQALSEGLSNAAIGVRLGISRSTVKFHLAAVFEKLGVHRRAEAVAAGIRRGDVLL
ncbi:response regulator transcription factor [Gemmatimonas groenlandica]|uniref:Helix-turn-helix transcriptional regulator n=1 Tax=Gemmatimonas groenlandica TaxID=2732249 RepID=A0A6M4IQQ0_9BACT|nr:helix-turn-helix transcriptional regulator [Gemmatimonas groenlandica]QJR37254.1 helix-turn-helix transcriptional regulator [Gemmatimonas groenlandica]